MLSSKINLVSLAALTTLAAASTITSTVTLFVPGVDESQPLIGSVLGSDESATTYVLDCLTVTETTYCGIKGPITLTEGPETAKYTIPAAVDPNGSVAFTGYIDCSLAGSVSAVCIESFGGTEVVSPGKSTQTYTGSDQAYMPVTITATARTRDITSTPTATAADSLGPELTAAPGSGDDDDGDGGTDSDKDKGMGTSTETGQQPDQSGAAVPGAVANANAGWFMGGAAVVAMALL